MPSNNFSLEHEDKIIKATTFYPIEYAKAVI